MINARPEHEPLIKDYGTAVVEMREVMQAEARRGRRFAPSAVAAARIVQREREAVAAEALRVLEAMAAMEEEDPQSVLEPTGMGIVEEPPTLRAPPSLRSIRTRQSASAQELAIAYPPDSTNDGDTTVESFQEGSDPTSEVTEATRF
jgi:hypothetical protein